jgi:hypothetical protein
MTIDRRLDRAYSALSGREAAIIALRTYKESRPPDAAFAMRLQGHEINEYNRLLAIMNLVNDELADIILVVREQVAQVELRLVLLRQIIDHSVFVAAVRKHLDGCRRHGEVVSKRGRSRDMRLDDLLAEEGAEIVLPLTLDDTPPASADHHYEPPDAARVLVQTIADGIASCWTQLQAVAKVVAEFAEEFDGEDPLKPDLRQYLDDALLNTEVCSKHFARFVDGWAPPDDYDEVLLTVRKLADLVLNDTRR